MDGQKSQAKLTRTQSSLLRSSPTTRSSIYSISSVNEITPEQLDLEEQKPHKPGTYPVRRGSSRLFPVLAVLSLALYTLFLHFHRDDRPTSENLLLALIFVAVTLFVAGKNKGSIHQALAILRQICDGYTKKLGFYKNNHKPVQWFIGESTVSRNDRKEKRIIREGVEFYRNGDFYEGEFHKGRCNGSGVYHYFVNGRYEGDWVDGRYDGYGIESWSRGSRYRGQYRQGLRHGYGVYRFYTGDAYSGEWCNGQSHGLGVQTCSDGSCYVGEFKCGVKHGFGCYHFSCCVEMETDTRGNTSGTESMDSASITSRMATVTRARGTKAVSKATACIHSETAMQGAVNGILAILRRLFPHRAIQSFEQFRLQEKQPRM